ncbi:hypothetical protein C8Q79DRAFT_737033 [Trametes meyenii]|nr:hypothetical protein C8Q79DRAFT_737033 [Trametes meyenii]
MLTSRTILCSLCYEKELFFAHENALPDESWLKHFFLRISWKRYKKYMALRKRIVAFKSHILTATRDALSQPQDWETRTGSDGTNDDKTMETYPTIGTLGRGRIGQLPEVDSFPSQYTGALGPYATITGSRRCTSDVYSSALPTSSTDSVWTSTSFPREVFPTMPRSTTPSGTIASEMDDASSSSSTTTTTFTEFSRNNSSSRRFSSDTTPTSVANSSVITFGTIGDAHMDGATTPISSFYSADRKGTLYQEASYLTQATTGSLSGTLASSPLARGSRGSTTSNGSEIRLSIGHLTKRKGPKQAPVVTQSDNERVLEDNIDD